MIARFAFIVLLSTCSAQVGAQEDVLTTFILVRHAEKEGENKMTGGTKDPKLSAEGMRRAEKLAALLSKTQIDAVYSTPFARTRLTVEPLARFKSIPVVEYQPNNLDFIDKIAMEHKGKTILLCGHSNTIPKIANHLTQSGKFKDFDDADYGNILIISVSSPQKSSTITWLTY
ncbi:MAG TPA: phosphoglycerate mutase family protein [Cyclobacteriaceae bacterium]|jgi:broad specificity phosphatase PhoE|nr:phosphoglycerate mutase family protein [Cyclobacteriaceae bacterium]